MTFTDATRAFAFASVGLCALAVGGTVLMLGHHAVYSLGKFDIAIAGANQTMATINRKNGTLEEFDKVILAAKSIEVHTDSAIAHEDANLSKVDAGMAQTFTDLHGTLVGAQTATASLNATVTAASGDLHTLDSAIAGLQPLEANLTLAAGDADMSVRDFDGLLKSKDLVAVLHNSASITESGAHIVAIGDQVSTKATYSYLHPSKNPWKRGWQATEPWVYSALKIGAAIAP